jgi:hypothetical protein
MKLNKINAMHQGISFYFINDKYCLIATNKNIYSKGYTTRKRVVKGVETKNVKSITILHIEPKALLTKKNIYRI